MAASLLHHTKKTSAVKNAFHYAQKLLASPSPSSIVALGPLPRARVLRDGPVFSFSTLVSDKVCTGGEAKVAAAAAPGIWCSWKSEENKLRFNVDAACDLKTYLVDSISDPYPPKHYRFYSSVSPALVGVVAQPPGRYCYWIFPAQNKLKFNVDGSNRFNKLSGIPVSGSAGVLRNCRGLILLVYQIRSHPFAIPSIAEFFALRYALQLMYEPENLNLDEETLQKLNSLKNQFTKEQLNTIEFETDSKEVAFAFDRNKKEKEVKKQDDNIPESDVVSSEEMKTYLIIDIRRILRLKRNVVVVHAVRECNFLADYLAREAQKLAIGKYWIIFDKMELEEAAQTLGDEDASGVGRFREDKQQQQQKKKSVPTI